jgi:hypothetical protein
MVAVTQSAWASVTAANTAVIATAKILLSFFMDFSRKRGGILFPLDIPII